MSWLPHERITVNVESIGPKLRTLDTLYTLWIVQPAMPTMISVRQRLAPGEKIIIDTIGNPPTKAVPFAGIFMPRPEWVW